MNMWPFGRSTRQIEALQNEIMALRGAPMSAQDAGTYPEVIREGLPVYDGGLENLAAGLGSALDRTNATRFVDVQNLNLPDADAAYRATWLARKMNDLPADEMFRKWITVQWDGSGDNTSDVTRVMDALTTFGVRRHGRSCKRWARLYGGAVFVLGLGTDDMREPFDRAKVKRGDLRWLRPFDRHRCIAIPMPLTADPESPNYGLPNYYQLMNVDGTPMTGAQTGIVHWSRVVRWEGREVPWFKFRANGYWHDSNLLAMIDSLKGYGTTTAGIANMVFDANVDVMKSAKLVERIGMKNGKDLIFQRYSVGAMLKSMYRMLIIDKDNEDYERKTYAFSGLSNVMNEFRIDCAGAADMPVTKLFGTSATGLNATGEGDQTSFYDDVAAKQESEVRPPLFETVKLVVGSVLGKIPQGLTITFDPLWQMPEAQAATTQLQRAQTRKIYFDMSAIGAELIAKQLYREKLFPDMERSDIALAKALEGTAREESANSPPMNPREPKKPGEEAKSAEVPPSEEEQA